MPTWVFLGGYLVAWTVYGLLAYGIFRAINAVAATRSRGTAPGRTSPAAAIVAAGLYQLTPIKDVCLRHCRTPLHFLLHGWHEGKSVRSAWASSTASTASAAAGA